MALNDTSDRVHAHPAYIRSVDSDWDRAGRRRISGCSGWCIVDINVDPLSDQLHDIFFMSKGYRIEQDESAKMANMYSGITLSNPGTMPPNTIIKEAQLVDHLDVVREAQVHLDPDMVWATATTRNGTKVWGHGDSEAEALRDLASYLAEMELPPTGDPIEEWYQLSQ